MRWSNLFVPTLRDAPGDAEAVSHKLLVRGGFMRQLHAGHYSMLPLGWKVHEKVAAIVRDEMNMIGGQEFLLPAMHPKSLWEASGRWDVMGEEMFRLEDRSGAEVGLGMTHEEGEDDVVRCPNCDYRANVERATSALDPITDEPGPGEPEKFATPGIRTIKALEDAGAPATSQMKSMIMVLDGAITIAVVRGDHQLNMQKLQDSTGAIDIRPATPEETLEHLGARPGSLGAVGVREDITILVDHALEGRTNLTTGANEDDWHYRGVDVARDVNVAKYVDLREVGEGEQCPKCKTPIEIVRSIEAGHIFKLGTQYSEAMNAFVLDTEGEKRSIVMGSYGIGIGRNMATIAETHNDDNGLVWPVSVAPFEVCITVMKIDDEDTMNAAEALYGELRSAGIDVLIDDRDARAGVKFADCELIGIPYRVTMGPRGIVNGQVELTDRATMETVDVSLTDIAQTVTSNITNARR